MEVLVKARMEVVEHGKHYRGFILFPKTKLDYEIRLEVSTLEELRRVSFMDADKILSLIQINIIRYNQNLILTSDEYSVFYHIIVAFVYNFFPEQQICASGGKSKVDFMKFKKFRKFPADICRILNRPKFDCGLIPE